MHLRAKAQAAQASGKLALPGGLTQKKPGALRWGRCRDGLKCVSRFIREFLRYRNPALQTLRTPTTAQVRKVGGAAWRTRGREDGLGLRAGHRGGREGLRWLRGLGGEAEGKEGKKGNLSSVAQF